MSLELVIVITLFGLTIFFTYLASVSDYPDILRIFFTIISFLILLITLNTSIVIASDNFGSSLSDTMTTVYNMGLWIFFIVVIYIIVVTGVSVVHSMKEKKQRKLSLLDYEN